MMKKKILAAIVAFTLCMASFTSCGKGSSSTGLDDGKYAAATAAVVATDDEKALAKELMDRSVTQDDVITDGVVNEVISLLKEKYTFEDVGTILVSGDYDTYAAIGKGWYTALFEDSGIKVEIQESVDDNEPTLMERGELTFANRMLYPYLLDKKNDPDNKIIAVWNSDDPPKEDIAVVVKADSDYTSFADLKGKKIASSAAGCPYSALVELAQNQGWTVGKDFEHVNTKEYASALIAGEVDAIVYHPMSQTGQLVVNGEGKIIDTAVDGGIYQTGGGDRVIFAPTDYVKSNPNVVHGYVKLMELVGAWCVNNAQEAGEVRESIDRSSPECAVLWIDSAVGTFYTNPDSLDKLKENARSFSEWLSEFDDNFDSPIDVENGFFDEDYFA